jgi:pimeloyl-ACP methyl ester carboxylesterase
MRSLLFFIASLLLFLNGISQEINYGSNPGAGKHVQAGDAKLYYEVYGSGAPLVLLHGDTFGYIDEFAPYIPELSRQYKVIIPAMRGHGRSAPGSRRYSYALFADDVLAILKQENVGAFTAVGFSSGATTALYLAALARDRVQKIVALGGAIDTMSYRKESLEELRRLTGADYEKMAPGFIAERKKLMGEPDAFYKLVDNMKHAWLQPEYITASQLGSVKCPVLIIGGDQDEYMDAAAFRRVQSLIPGSQLSIVPGCNHVGLITDAAIFRNRVFPFLALK